MGRTGLLFALALLLLPMGLGGCGGEAEREPVETRLRVISPTRVQTKIMGGTARQRQVLREILAGLGTSTVETVAVVEPEADMGGPPNGVALNVRIPRADWFAYWQADVLGDVFWRRSNELRLPPVIFLSVLDIGGHGLSHTKVSRTPPLTMAKAREIAGRIGLEAGKRGARVRRLELLDPDRPAFVIVLQADDPADFLLNEYESVFAPLRDRIREADDGAYIEILDREGERVLMSGAAYSVREEFASCGPGLLSGPMGWNPPPCPAHWLVSPR